MPGCATHRTRRSRWSQLAAGVVLAALAAAGCGSSSPSTPADSTRLLDRARAVVAKTTAVHFVLARTAGSGGGSGLVLTGGQGDIARPGLLSGTFTVETDGVTASVGVLAKGGTFLVKLPFQSTYARTNPATYGISDPSTLLDPGRGLSALLGAATSVTATGQARVGGDVINRLSARVPGSAVTIPPDHAPSRPVSLVIGVVPGSGQVRTLALTGPFGADDATQTYTLTLTDYDESVHVTLPSS
jgi:lipoprotein LprG